MTSTPYYANRRHLRAAGDITVSPEADAAVDRALQAGTERVETLCLGRRFYPSIETRSLDWFSPTNQSSDEYWLDDHELLSLDTLTVAGTAIAASAYRLWPTHTTPARSIQMLDSGGQSFSTGDDGDRGSVSITGTFGAWDTTEATGTLATTLSDTTGTTVVVTDGSDIDAGDAIKLDSEYMVVTDTAWTATSDTLASELSNSKNDISIAVTDGSTYAKGEFLLIDSERLQIVDIAGNTLTIKRSRDGTNLATHASSTAIFAQRTYTVTRGAMGTTPATHTASVTVNRLAPPADIVSLCLAEAITQMSNERARYALTVGEGENEREAKGASLKDLRRTVFNDWGPKGRVFAVGGWPT